MFPLIVLRNSNGTMPLNCLQLAVSCLVAYTTIGNLMICHPFMENRRYCRNSLISQWLNFHQFGSNIPRSNRPIMLFSKCPQSLKTVSYTPRTVEPNSFAGVPTTILANGPSQDQFLSLFLHEIYLPVDKNTIENSWSPKEAMMYVKMDQRCDSHRKKSPQAKNLLTSCAEREKSRFFSLARGG